MIDLHCHSTFSDGSMTPAELMKRARDLKMRALAITDHDTIAGWDLAQMAAQENAIEFVPGVELSTLYKGRLLHLLGYYPDPSTLRELLVSRLQSRRQRSKCIIAKLTGLGMHLEVSSLVDRESLGRPHIAQLMADQGFVQSKREAFDLWIGEDKPAYVPYEPYSAAQGVRDLLRCGAVPIWAHPGIHGDESTPEIFIELLAAGLKGIEVYHPTHSPKQVERFLSMTSEHGLVATGGSDYHGPILDDTDRIHLDLNGLCLSEFLLESLKAASHTLRLKS